MSSIVVQKLWNYCNVLRDDGMSYSDYVEQLTYLLFLKMADERALQGEVLGQILPETLGWKQLLQEEGQSLFEFYSALLRKLGKQAGTLSLIFGTAQNKFADPSKLRRLIVELIDKENWTAMSGDVKGDAYEGLLEKNSQDTKSGAGQYFTPRALVRAIVEVVDPQIGETICDPACGTGGFMTVANESMRPKDVKLTARDERILREKTFTGYELVPATARLAAMNMLLHGVGGSAVPIVVGDALATLPTSKYDIVLSNPPFGKKGSATIVGEDRKGLRETDQVSRPDFWATTSNKQLNFVQHIYSILAPGGRAAIVIPDNVLFEGGAGELIRRKLLECCDVHTLLRLPAGLFYAQGIKANVLFLTKRKPKTRLLWVYDLRVNKRFTLKSNPLDDSDLDDFKKCYGSAKRGEAKSSWSTDNSHGRWRAYTYDEIYERDQINWDISWLRSADPNIEFSGMSSQELLENMSVDLEEVLSDIRELSEVLER
jgi:type I restriction enzyme M protein